MSPDEVLLKRVVSGAGAIVPIASKPSIAQPSRTLTSQSIRIFRSWMNSEMGRTAHINN
jgi:hypothetical protein